ncbi:MAG: hypothetical protein KC543_03355 [Myxococcales bacterium]|nr:hypothetical protein [Myxococcales bacterium]
MTKDQRNPDRGERAARGRVIRRDGRGTRTLPPELEAFARSDDKRLPPRERPEGLRDPRAAALVPGVSNHDARIVHDRRVAALRALIDADAACSTDTTRSALGRALAEARALELWRGRSVADFDAFAEGMLGLDPARARALADDGDAGLFGPSREAGAAVQAPAARQADRELDPEAVAVWMRLEAALDEAAVPGFATLAPRDAAEAAAPVKLRLDLAAGSAPEALHLIGRRMTPLVRDHEKAREERAKRARARAARRREVDAPESDPRLHKQRER